MSNSWKTMAKNVGRGFRSPNKAESHQSVSDLPVLRYLCISHRQRDGEEDQIAY